MTDVTVNIALDAIPGRRVYNYRQFREISHSLHHTVQLDIKCCKLNNPRPKMVLSGSNKLHFFAWSPPPQLVKQKPHQAISVGASHLKQVTENSSYPSFRELGVQTAAQIDDDETPFLELESNSNTLLCACAHNLRKILNKLRLFCTQMGVWLSDLLAMLRLQQACA